MAPLKPSQLGLIEGATLFPSFIWVNSYISPGHQPEIRWLEGCSPHKPPFGVNYFVSLEFTQVSWKWARGLLKGYPSFGDAVCRETREEPHIFWGGPTQKPIDEPMHTIDPTCQFRSESAPLPILRGWIGQPEQTNFANNII